MYHVSQYTVAYPSTHGDSVLVHLLRPAMDQVPRGVAEAMETGRCDILDTSTLSYLASRGYVVTEGELEEAAYRAEYEELRDIPPSMMLYYILPTIYCNFSCPYCFQQNLMQSPAYMSSGTLGRVLNVIREMESVRQAGQARSLLTIMGGEVFYAEDRPEIRSFIETVRESADAGNIDVLYYSNGDCLQTYFDVLSHASLNLTIDGTREVHDRRRCRKDGTGTYDKIVGNALRFIRDRKPGCRLYIRMNVDADNLTNLPHGLAALVDVGMFDNPDVYWYPALIVAHAGQLSYPHFSRSQDVVREALHVSLSDSRLFRSAVFNRFRGVQFVLDLLLGCAPGKYPQYYRCHSNYNGISFDRSGNAYPCHACLDKPAEGVTEWLAAKDIIGSTVFREWRRRDVYATGECQTCPGKYICLGGCPRECLEHNGSIFRPRCYPYREEIGTALDILLSDKARPVVMEAANANTEP